MVANLTTAAGCQDPEAIWDVFQCNSWSNALPLHYFEHLYGKLSKQLIACALAILAIGVSILGLLTHSGCGTSIKTSREFEAFQKKYDLILLEMTEEEVESIFTGYKSDSANQTRQINPHDLQPFKRVSTYNRMFFQFGTLEGDYCIRVYFDSDGYVVGKSIGVLVS